MSESRVPGKVPEVSLLPREHGAYAWMAFPQISVLILGSVQVPAVLLATAVVCVFLLHEPVLVMVGRRGPRALRTAGSRARRRAAVLGASGLTLGLAGLLLSPVLSWTAILVVLGLGGALLLFELRGTQKSLWGEGTAALAFAAASVPTALAGGLPGYGAWLVAGVWGCVFILATLTVRAVIDRHKRGRRLPAVILGGTAAVLGMGILASSLGAANPGPQTTILPTLVVMFVVLASGLGPRHLRRLGWSLVAADVATLMLLLILFS